MKEKKDLRLDSLARGCQGCPIPTDERQTGDLSGGPKDVAAGSGKMKQKIHLSCESSGLFFTGLCMSSPKADLFTATVRCFPCSL